MNESQAEYMRGHFARQRDLHQRAVHATVRLATVNTELVFRNGLAQLERQQKVVVGEQQVQEIKDLIGMEPDGKV